MMPVCCREEEKVKGKAKEDKGLCDQASFSTDDSWDDWPRTDCGLVLTEGR